MKNIEKRNMPQIKLKCNFTKNHRIFQSNLRECNSTYYNHRTHNITPQIPIKTFI